MGGAKISHLAKGKIGQSAVALQAGLCDSGVERGAWQAEPGRGQAVRA
jgi:hypothetical protein